MNVLTMMRLGFKLIQHREQISDAVEGIKSVINLFPELTQPNGQPAPEPSPGSEFTTTWLQESLNTLNDAGLEVDGEYGPATQAAVTKYQQQHGLEVDGWAGMQTVTSIYEELQK